MAISQGTYSPASPWMNLDDLNQSFIQGDPNASYDPDVQAQLNMAAASPTVPPNNGPVQTTNPLDFLNGMIPNSPQGSGASPDFGPINKLLAGLDVTKNKGYQAEQDSMDRLKKYRDQMPTGQQGMDLTGLMTLADAWNPQDGKVFTGSYKAPETAQERAAKIAGVDQELIGNAGKMSAEEMAGLKDRLTGEIAKLHYGAMGNQKVADQDQKAAQKFETDIAADKASSRSPLGGAANRVYAAQRVNTLIGQYPDPNKMPPQQVHELAISLNSLLAPGNPNVTMYEDIVPKSARGSEASIENWLTNNPGGANQGEFVKNLASTVNREAQVSQDQVKNYMKTKAGASAQMGWVKRNPDLFKSIVAQHLSSPTISGMSPSSPQAPKAGDVEDGHKFLGGNPADPKNWVEM